MIDEASPFTPAVGMVDRLDSRGFGPTAEDYAFAEAYLAHGDLDPAWVAKLADPERRAAREALSVERKARDWPALSQYREANEALAGQPVDVVFIGDSITEFWRWLTRRCSQAGSSIGASAARPARRSC